MLGKIPVFSPPRQRSLVDYSPWAAELDQIEHTQLLVEYNQECIKV